MTRMENKLRKSFAALAGFWDFHPGRCRKRTERGEGRIGSGRNQLRTDRGWNGAMLGLWWAWRLGQRKHDRYPTNSRAHQCVSCERVLDERDDERGDDWSGEWPGDSRRPDRDLADHGYVFGADSAEQQHNADGGRGSDDHEREQHDFHLQRGEYVHGDDDGLREAGAERERDATERRDVCR